MAIENFPQFNFPHWRQSLKQYATNLSATKDTDTGNITVTITLLTDSPAARTACETLINASVASRGFNLTFQYQ